LILLHGRGYPQEDIELVEVEVVGEGKRAARRDEREYHDTDKGVRV